MREIGGVYVALACLQRDNNGQLGVLHLGPNTAGCLVHESTSISDPDLGCSMSDKNVLYDKTMYIYEVFFGCRG